jgi:ferrous iron transport protein B
MCVFAYAVSLVTYQLGSWVSGTGNIPGTVAALLVLALLLFLLFRPDPNRKKAKKN